MVGDHLLSRDFGPSGIIFMNVRVVITVAMRNALKGFWALCLLPCRLVGHHLLLSDSGPYGIIFMTMCVYYFGFSHNS
jgi:hypothetical protein